MTSQTFSMLELQVEEQDKECRGLEQYNWQLEAKLALERNVIVSQQQQVRIFARIMPTLCL